MSSAILPLVVLAVHVRTFLGNTDFTRLQKFTCDVCTRFSDLELYITPPVVPKFTLELRMREGAKPIVLMDHATTDDVRVLIKPLRIFIDVLEPWHWRRVCSEEEVYPWLVLSYWWASFRWKDGILALYPQFECILDFLETFCYGTVSEEVNKMDRWPLQNEDLWMPVHLNNLYEIISAMKHSSRIDQFTREHIQSALAHHILRVYRRMLPAKTSFHKSGGGSLETLRLVFHVDFGISELFPPRYLGKVRLRQMLRRSRINKGRSIRRLVRAREKRC